MCNSSPRKLKGSETSNQVYWDYAEGRTCPRAFAPATWSQRSPPQAQGLPASSLQASAQSHSHAGLSALASLLRPGHIHHLMSCVCCPSPVFQHTCRTQAPRPPHRGLPGSWLGSQLQAQSLAHGRCSANTCRMHLYDLGPAPGRATFGRARKGAERSYVTSALGQTPPRRCPGEWEAAWRGSYGLAIRKLAGLKLPICHV